MGIWGPEQTGKQYLKIMGKTELYEHQRKKLKKTQQSQIQTLTLYLLCCLFHKQDPHFLSNKACLIYIFACTLSMCLTSKG